MIYTPDEWLLVKISPKGEDSIYKVFATWIGGYLGADSWKLNSGIVGVTEDENSYSFHGYSGSEYVCSKSCYGATGYGYGVLANLQDKLHTTSEHRMQILEEEKALEYIHSKLKENK